MTPLTSARYLAFPLRLGADGPETADRARHVRDLIEQVIFTHPGERVFRPDFGAGVKALVFEPAGAALVEITRKRLLASLTEALQGEVDPRTLAVEVTGAGERLEIVVSYTIATIGRDERHVVRLGAAAGGPGG